jgi:hypothetical protein
MCMNYNYILLEISYFVWTYNSPQLHMSDVGASWCCFSLVVHPATDPCNRPPLCLSGDDPELVADPDDCKKYFQCLNSQWAHFTCPGDSTFDSKANACATNHDNCFPACPVYTGASTVSATRVPSGKHSKWKCPPCLSSPIPDTCPGTTDNCTEGENYPDASSCLSYYVCEDGELQLKFCSGFTPVFDIHVLKCVELSPGFDCEYRCKTAGPSTEQPTTELTTMQSTSQQAATTDQTERHTERLSTELTTTQTTCSFSVFV